MSHLNPGHEPAAIAQNTAPLPHHSADVLPLPPHEGGKRRGEERVPRSSQNNELMRILIIDDNPEILSAFRKILVGTNDLATNELDALEASLFESDKAETASQERRHFDVDLVQNGETGCEHAFRARDEERPYAVAFVDMRMPGGWDGVKTIEELWYRDPRIQVVICTAYSDYSWDEINSRLGSTDQLLILRKPFDKIEVLQLASALSDKWRLHREQQARLDELEQRVEERTQHLRLALTEREMYQKQLHYQATHDALTGLPNRNMLDDRIRQAIAQAKRSGRPAAVMFLDLDRFKFVNDSYGHPTGDALLKVIAERLKRAVRNVDTVVRVGGDEFVIVLPELAKADDVGIVAQRILVSIAEPVPAEGHELQVSGSIGVSLYDENGEDCDTLLKHADAALYYAKEAGRNNIQLFAREMGIQAEERITLEHALRQALVRQEFELHFQPKVELRTNQVLGVEVLIRWRRPGIGLVSPAKFIPLAEDTGLIIPIGEWVLRTACAQCKAWQDMGHGDLSVAVNVSGRQFRQRDFPAVVAKALSDIGLAPQHLELELTESILMQDKDNVGQALDALKAMGVQISLDDFGTGYSSLSYLRRFPIDVVKIDRSFIRDITTNASDAALTKAIIAMAKSLKLGTVGEGVETRDQLDFLKINECDAVQGFHFSPPVPAEELTVLLGRLKRPPSE